MPVNPLPPAVSRRHLWVAAVPAAVAFGYACAHLSWYLETPLGRVPVLDERENLALAEAIFQGTLPAEPFYRAPGYALMLATLRALGVPAGGLFSVALLLGAAFHAVNAACIALIARRWFSEAAALAAGLLCALHPVFVHYATQALDATPALSLFLAGLCCIAPRLATGPTTDSANAWRWMGASMSWAAAALLRPNYLFVWAILPLLAWRGNAAGTRRRALPAALAGGCLFLFAASWQKQVSGVAGFLPWQGAYNLWAANQPGAHGRYYTQHVSLPPELALVNPARAESVLLYQQETGLPGSDIAAMNSYWRQRFLHHVVHHPVAWLGQLAAKTYALLNNWEQYNNKTFAFHKMRSPWLRWNPLSWGILFVLGVGGAWRLAAESPRTARALALITGACAASVLLFFVSARFRLPLAALATVLAGGALAAPGFWRKWTHPRQLFLGGTTALAAVVAFSAFGHVRDAGTFAQDHALLSRAAATVGDDALAWREAMATLALQPAHPDAVRLAVASYFNQLLDGTANAADELPWLGACERLLNSPQTDAPDLRAIAAVGLWRAGQRPAALTVWRELGTTPSALAARLLVHDASARRSEFVALPPVAWNQPLVRLAATALAVTPPPGITPQPSERATAAIARIFSSPPVP